MFVQIYDYIRITIKDVHDFEKFNKRTVYEKTLFFSSKIVSADVSIDTTLCALRFLATFAS